MIWITAMICYLFGVVTGLMLVLYLIDDVGPPW
jgi:uncharacterized membrane protein